MNSYLFVYGTLKSDSEHPAAVRLRECARLAGTGHVLGRKRAMGRYFGLTQLPGEEDRVHGEVWELANPEEAFRWLDPYEGPDYERVETPVTMADRVATAWCYRTVILS
ncbi:MAG: gamma-glutamylcyclotransferase family protein [Bryobacteraceae bacterium]|nr:gamma-glutamylcyclotransferase family protein [Bryobacteraceae bacterium]